MASYQNMYYNLFNKITDAINLLQTAQIESEEMFISQQEPDTMVLDKLDTDK